MNISQLRTLITVADSPSFVVAAETLFITPSAVSHQMRELEEELDTALFDRSTRPPRLNAHGHAVVERGRKVLIEFDALIETAKSPDKIAGKLMLGCVTGISSDLIPVALSKLRASYPSVYVRIEEGMSQPLADRVRRRELDAAIITELPDADPELQSLLITEEALFVVASSKSNLSDWRKVLQNYPFLCLNRATGVGTLIDQTILREGLVIEEAMETDSSELIVSMAKAGLGAGVVPAGRLRHFPAGTVNVIPFGDPPIYRKVVLIERCNNARSDLSRIVYTELKKLTDKN